MDMMDPYSRSLGNRNIDSSSHEAKTPGAPTAVACAAGASSKRPSSFSLAH